MSTQSPNFGANPSQIFGGRSVFLTECTWGVGMVAGIAVGGVRHINRQYSKLFVGLESGLKYTPRFAALFADDHRSERGV
jgi:hypothetical protein